MSHWLITYDYRLHRRHGTQGNCGAIHLDEERGRTTEVVEIDPVTWLLGERERWKRLQDDTKTPGEAMSNIVVLYAIAQASPQS